jgi:hypothetical protein
MRRKAKEGIAGEKEGDSEHCKTPEVTDGEAEECRLPEKSKRDREGKFPSASNQSEGEREKERE